MKEPQFDTCPKCESKTIYGPVKDGGEGLHCTKCPWQAVTIKWAAGKVEGSDK